MNLILFGDGQAATASLARLIDLGLHISAVVPRCRPSDPELLAYAEKKRLPVLAQAKINSPDFVAKLRALRPEICLSISFDQIFQTEILEIPRAFVNFHVGSLPNFRGRNTTNWTIINGEESIDIVAHFIDEGIDTGDIIHRATLPISWTDSYGEVLAREVAAFPDLVEQTMELLQKEPIPRQKQKHLTGSVFAGRGPGDEWIDWTDSSKNIHNKIRGIARPGPGARTLLNGEEIIIWKACYDLKWPQYLGTAGQVVSRDQQGIFVKTGDSMIKVLEVEPHGQQTTTAQWPIGSRFTPTISASAFTLQKKIKKLEEELQTIQAKGSAK